MNIAQLVQQCAITDQPLTIEEVARVRIYLQTIDDLCLEHIERALATARKNWTHAREEADRYKAAEGVEIAVLNRIKRASPQPTDNRQAALLQRCVLEELQTRYAMFDDALSEQIDEYYSAIIALEKLRHVYVTLYPEAQLSPRTARAELEASPTRRRCLLPPSLTITYFNRLVDRLTEVQQKVDDLLLALLLSVLLLSKQQFVLEKRNLQRSHIADNKSNRNDRKHHEHKHKRPPRLLVRIFVNSV
jgi:hypothetical protein